MLSFVGWGGLAEVFDETSDAYAAERERLKAGLTEREYAKARESTLTAYYTPIEVARAVCVYCQALADKIGVMISTLSAFCVPTAFPTSEICQA